ncbi:MAG: hypothetical protein ACR2L8_08165, partial [Solirubrobacteraceae bacterium]
LTLNAGEIEEMFAVLAEMEEHVRRVAEGDESGPAPHGFNVIATRDLKAGQLVRSGDFTLYPPTNSKSPPAES